MNNLDNFNTICRQLEKGEIRVAEYKDGDWFVNPKIKEAILEGFRYGKMKDFSQGTFSFFDKDSVPARQFTMEDKVRIVPGGTTVRCGAYLAPSVVVMPPAYVNIGAYIDEGTMIDSHALVGSCAQVGKRVHLSAAAQLGGVLEPIGALPVIIEDDVFIGGNCGIYEGTIVKSKAVIASGVIITRGTQIYDLVNDCFIKADEQNRIIIPEGAVVVAGSRPIANNARAMQVYTPIIVKYRDEKTDSSIVLEDILR